MGKSLEFEDALPCFRFLYKWITLSHTTGLFLPQIVCKPASPCQLLDLKPFTLILGWKNDSKARAQIPQRDHCKHFWIIMLLERRMFAPSPNWQEQRSSAKEQSGLLYIYFLWKYTLLIFYLHKFQWTCMNSAVQTANDFGKKIFDSGNIKYEPTE